MFFRRKEKLRKEFDEKLLFQLEYLKEEWMRQKNLIEKSIDPSDEVLYELKLVESKYFFLLREAKCRRIFLGKS
jgi:hypothetical protein